MQYGFFEAGHAREIAKNTRRTRDMRQPARRLSARELNSAQPFWIGKAEKSLIYTAKQTSVQSVEVKMWSFDGSDEAEGTETITAHDFLMNGCLKGEPLWLYRRPWGEGFRWYFIGTWNAIIVKGSVGARSGTTPGSASCDWFEIDDSGELIDTNENVTCLNLASDATDPDAFLQAKKSNGIWLIDFEECLE